MVTGSVRKLVSPLSLRAILSPALAWEEDGAVKTKKVCTSNLYLRWELSSSSIPLDQLTVGPSLRTLGGHVDTHALCIDIFPQWAMVLPQFRHLLHEPLDPEVWKHLADHEDILRLILSRVSWDTVIYVLRSVSKAFYAMLSEPSVLTWASMLTDTSFYLDHSGLRWVGSEVEIDRWNLRLMGSGSDGGNLGQSQVGPICLLSTSQRVTYGVVNFELDRWCKLPPLGDLPFGNLNDFKLIGVAEGLLLLERTISEVNMCELDRFLFNPLTRGFIKLPVVPVIEGNTGIVPTRLRMIMAVEVELVTVVAVESYSQLRHEPPRILTWHQGSQDWELLEATLPLILPVDNRMFVDGPVTNAVFVGGELFLHVETDKDRVFSFGIRATQPELIWSSNTSRDVETHLFQHNGVLKRLEWSVVVDMYRTTLKYLGCWIKLYTFSHANRTWEQESTVMPRRNGLGKQRRTEEMVLEKSKVVGVLGDILCIRNEQKPSVFLLYNFLTKQWCRCFATRLAADFDYTIFLWSPKRYDSWHFLAPRVR
ncbi:hypothetical protein R1sor_003376 [Riccia sorocarpa]|uniref:F-box domain-containing protein n=1 Tax=Riccia sorocarpa TaxID=122646 RepID=A0ABD3H7K1_9MARC